MKTRTYGVTGTYRKPPKRACRSCQRKKFLVYTYKDMEKLTICDYCGFNAYTRLTSGAVRTTPLIIPKHVNGCQCDGEEGEWDIRCIARIPEVKRLIFGSS